MVWNDLLVAQADSVPDLYSRDGKSWGGGGGLPKFQNEISLEK